MSIEWIRKYFKIIEKSGLPVRNLVSIDITGNFVIEEINGSDDYRKYVGKIKGDGLITKIYGKYGYPCDLDTYDMTVYNDLKVYNIDGYNFHAGTENHDLFDSSEAKIKANELIIDSLYSNYDVIIDELKKGTTDEYIKDLFKLNSFSSHLIDSKTK